MTRIRDIVVAAVGLAMLSPLLLILAVLIRLDSPGSALYRQERVGLHGSIFRIHKFRSMRTGAVGLSLSTDGDSRITRVGRWVRASKLDELPQLIDVLRGDMSLVGPRPEVPEYVASWPDLERELILSVHPGITDPASVILRHESAMLAAVDDPDRYYREVLLPLKTTVYVNYVTRRSFAGDFAVLVATLRALITPAPAVTKDLARRFGADFEDGGLGKCCTI